MNGQDGMDFNDEGQFYEEGEDMYDDFVDGGEFIEVNGRFIPHNPNHQQPQASTSAQRPYPNSQVHQVRRPVQNLASSSNMHTSSSSSQFTGPERENVTPVVVKEQDYASDDPDLEYSNGSDSQEGQRQHRPVYIPRGPDRILAKKITGEYYQEMQVKQEKAFFEMREQVNIVRQKTKKKIYAPGQRKPCNCTKSQCLKLYCDCFANGEFCRDCNCKDCHNNIGYDGARTKAIRQSLERNPNAFKPKIGIAKSGTTDIERLHQKGCHCKKSGCLKNYCECYEAKVPCTDRCKCRGCQNTESYRMSRYKGAGGSSANALMSLATAASGAATPDSRQSSVVTDDVPNEEGYDEMGYPAKPAAEKDPKRFPWFYMTDEVVEAATLCMVAQAEEALTTPYQRPITDEEREFNMERLVIREFGRCLEQIITNAAESEAEAAAGKS